jgi:exosortase
MRSLTPEQGCAKIPLETVRSAVCGLPAPTALTKGILGYNWLGANAHGVQLSSTAQPGKLSRQDLAFILFLTASVVAFWKPLSSLLSFSLSRDYASHIVLIIPISAFLIYRMRAEIFAAVKTAPVPGILLFLTGIAFLWLALRRTDSPLHGNGLSLVTFAIVVIWISAFVFFYGTLAFYRALFPLLFLLLLIPIPELAVDKIIFFLQAGSAMVAYGLLRLLSIPVLKQGFILTMPNLAIEVAKECSGIRSSLALLVTALIFGEFVLRTTWKKGLWILSIVPVLIFKNGVRIVTLCLLTIYVNPGFLHGWLHTSGGILFYLLGLVILLPILNALRKSEKQPPLTFQTDSHVRR